MTVPINTRVTFFTEFYDDNDALADPTAVTLKLRAQRGGPEVVLTYAGGEVVKTATGKYKASYVLDQPGEWYARWNGAGGPVTAGSLDVVIKVATTRLSV
jgi:hypothetical protein